MPLTLEQKVELLWDKLAVSELMHAFGRALDLHDWVLYERCLCAELEVDFKRLTGFEPVHTTAADWTAFAANALGKLTVHHQYSNHSIRVKGDEAVGITYMVARHYRSEDTGWNTQYGWYENVFARDDGEFGWKIRRLKHDFQWTSGVPDLIDLGDPLSQAALERVFLQAVQR
ncbi:MAG: nuclear transport factor 2 family protein [Halioglobus sp.]|nr:nuclear transport factor 2 family protein [Halioglobus sp.]